MTAPTEREPRAMDSAAVDRAALTAFLSGPAKGVALEPSGQHQHHSRGDADDVRRRRWGVGATVERASTRPAAPATPPNAGGSLWARSSWFAGGAADVAPVLADPTGADQGQSGIPRVDPAVGGASCQNRFTGPGQRDPLDPVVPRSVRLNASPVEDPGEVHGGHNARATATGGGVYRPVGGAMAHSRLSLQPRAPPRARGNTCADGHVAASSRDVTTACAFASAASRPEFVFDRERGGWEIRGTGETIRATREPPAETAEPADEDARVDAHQSVDQSADRGADQGAEEDAAAAALAASTRHLRLSRFEANHEAALAAAAAARRAAAAAAAAGASLKRAAAAPLAPLPPSRFPRRDHEAGVPRENAESADDPDPSSDFDASSEWQMLRLSSGEVVFFGAPDAHPSRVASWISGETPWPEIRVMELSRRERTHLDVPTRAPGPMASNALAETAKEELRVVAREDAERAAIEADANAEASGAVGRTGAVARLPPGSTATPQQANIIEQLARATGAGGAAGPGPGPGSRADTSDAAFETLREKLRETIVEKHEAIARAKAAESRVETLVAAMRDAGVPVPSKDER